MSAEQIPVIRVSVTRQFENGGVLAFETYAAQDMPLAQLNSLMDKLAETGDRQMLRAELEREKKLLYNDGAEIERMMHGLTQVDKSVEKKEQEHSANERRRGPFAIPESERKAREGIVANLDLLNDRRMQRRRRIAELERVLAGE